MTCKLNISFNCISFADTKAEMSLRMTSIWSFKTARFLMKMILLWVNVEGIWKDSSRNGGRTWPVKCYFDAINLFLFLKFYLNILKKSTASLWYFCDVFLHFSLISLPFISVSRYCLFWLVSLCCCKSVSRTPKHLKWIF